LVVVGNCAQEDWPEALVKLNVEGSGHWVQTASTFESNCDMENTAYQYLVIGVQQG
jgi:hypothetical protein